MDPQSPGLDQMRSVTPFPKYCQEKMAYIQVLIKVLGFIFRDGFK